MSLNPHSSRRQMKKSTQRQSRRRESSTAEELFSIISSAVDTGSAASLLGKQSHISSSFYRIRELAASEECFHMFVLDNNNCTFWQQTLACGRGKYFQTRSGNKGGSQLTEITLWFCHQAKKRGIFREELNYMYNQSRVSNLQINTPNKIRWLQPR